MKILPVVLWMVVGLVTAFGQKLPSGLSSRLEIPSAEFTLGGPAVTPIRAFQATFELANRTTSPVKVDLADGSPDPVIIAFRLLDRSGKVLWSSGELLAEETDGPTSLKPGQVWKRTLAVPLFLEDGQLKEGVYRVEAFVEGTPDYEGAASFRMTPNAIISDGSFSTVAGRQPQVVSALTLADSRVVVGLRNGSNVRLSGVVRAAFSLINRSGAAMPFGFRDSAASQRKIAFSLRDAEGKVIWQSDRDVVSLPVLVDAMLPAGGTWSRTFDIPLSVDGTALPEGDYTIVGEVEGFPVYRSATTIRVVNRAR